MKNCIKCGCELNSDNWAQNQRKNWINKCKSCLTSEKREYWREWNAKNPGRSAAAALKHKALLRQTNPIKARARSAYSDCRKRAIKGGMDFDLTPDAVFALMKSTLKCPYFGWELTFAEGPKEKTLASVDRIDSAKGYTLDNVQIVSYLANLMKSHATDAELLQFANGVLQLLGLGGLRTVEKINGVAATTHK